MRNSVNKIENEDWSKIEPETFKAYLKNVVLFTFPPKYL